MLRTGNCRMNRSQLNPWSLLIAVMYKADHAEPTDMRVEGGVGGEEIKETSQVVIEVPKLSLIQQLSMQLGTLGIASKSCGLTLYSKLKKQPALYP